MTYSHKITLIKIFIICTLSSLFLGCASIGSKEILKLDENSSWIFSQSNHESNYIFKCNKSSISISEIVFQLKKDSYGFIFPIFKSDYAINYNDHKLILGINIWEYIKSIKKNKEDFKIRVINEKDELILEDQKFNKIYERLYENPDKEVCGHYYLNNYYNSILKDIGNTLTIQFLYPLDNCVIPDLKLIRGSIPNNSFVIMPGH